MLFYANECGQCQYKLRECSPSKGIVGITSSKCVWRQRITAKLTSELQLCTLHNGRFPWTKPH